MLIIPTCIALFILLYCLKRQMLYSLLITIGCFIFVCRMACGSFDCLHNLIFFWSKSCANNCAICQANVFDAAICSNYCIDCDRTEQTCEQCESCKKQQEACKSCESCEVDWDIRAGIDEAGLTVFGTTLLFLLLWYKEYNVQDFINGLTTLNLFGALETELKKLEKDSQELDKPKSEPSSSASATNATYTKTATDSLLHSIQTVSNAPLMIKILQTEINNRDKDITAIINTTQSPPPYQKDFWKKVEDFIKKDAKLAYSHRIFDILFSFFKYQESIIQKLYAQNQLFYGEITDLSTANNHLSHVAENIITYSATIYMKDSNNSSFLYTNLTNNHVSINELLPNATYNIPPILDIELATNAIYLSFVLDASSSMKNNLENVKKSCLTILRKFQKTPKIFINFIVINDNKVLHITNNQQFSPLDEETIKRLEYALDSLQTGGGTPLWEALFKSAAMFAVTPQIAYRAIILISDGQDDFWSELTPRTSFEDVYSLFEKNDLFFYFIGYGKELNYLELEQLAQINNPHNSTQNCFVNSSILETSKNLQQIITALAQAYTITWAVTHSFRNQAITANITIKSASNKPVYTTIKTQYTIPQ